MSENQTNPVGEKLPGAPRPSGEEPAADPANAVPADPATGMQADPARAVPAATADLSEASAAPATGTPVTLPASDAPVPDPDPTAPAGYRVPQPPPATYPHPAPHPAPHHGSTAPQYGFPATPAPQPYPGQPPFPSAPQPAQPGSVRKGLVVAAAGLALALTGGVVGGVVGYSLHPDSSPLQILGGSGGDNAAPVVDRSSLASIAAALQPTIVDIRTTSGEGSGVIISSDGYIVTNNHVIEGARTVTVTFNSGSQVSGRVVNTDPLTDIAVIKVDADNLVHATWGDSDAVQVGDTVLAIGSPLGLQGSVTAGIVSGLHRTITVGQDQRSQFDTGTATTIGDALQTDAPINAGNSGGALVNMNGEVIGINTAIATSGSTGNIGVGFAISSNRARAVAEALIAGQAVHHPYIGVRISDATSGGAQLDEVVSGSPAAQAGLQSGDVVTRVGDRSIRGAEDLIGAIQSSSVGAQITLTVNRDGSEQTISVTVGEQ